MEGGAGGATKLGLQVQSWTSQLSNWTRTSQITPAPPPLPPLQRDPTTPMLRSSVNPMGRPVRGLGILLLALGLTETVSLRAAPAARPTNPFTVSKVALRETARFSRFLTPTQAGSLSSQPSGMDPGTTTFDLRSQAALSEPMDQHKTSICWTFAVAGAMRDRALLSGYDLRPLSAVQVAGCCHAQGCGGLQGGGNPRGAVLWAQKYGLPYEQCQPFPQKFKEQKPERDMFPSANCTKCSSHTVKATWTGTVSGIKSMIRALHQKLPLIASFRYSNDFSKYYGNEDPKPLSQPYSPLPNASEAPRCGNLNGHVVEVVGYHLDGPNSYWIAKNSWGPTWNGDGYFSMAMGACNGLDAYPAYVVRVLNIPLQLAPAMQQLTVGASAAETDTLPDTDDDGIGKPPSGPATQDNVVGGWVEVDTEEEEVQEAARFLAFETDPVVCDGDAQLTAVTSAELAGAMACPQYRISIVVGGVNCTAPSGFTGVVELCWRKKQIVLLSMTPANEPLALMREQHRPDKKPSSAPLSPAAAAAIAVAATGGFAAALALAIYQRQRHLGDQRPLTHYTEMSNHPQE